MEDKPGKRRLRSELHRQKPIQLADGDFFSCCHAFRRMGITHPDPGRPRTVARRRSPRVQARVDAYNEDSARFVDADPVFEAAKSGDELESLYLAREELAREAASLLFSRLQSVPGSPEMGRLASRRVRALREIASLTIAIARIDSAMPAPERLARIITNLLDVVGEAAREVLPPEGGELFRNAWRARLEPQLSKLHIHVLSVETSPAASTDGKGGEIVV